MISEFLSWWGQQLLSLRPARAGAGQRDALYVSVPSAGAASGVLTATMLRRGRAGELGAFPMTDAGMVALAAAAGPRRPPIDVRLPASIMLHHAVVLPLAAERDPDRVLRYEMDRLTPFTADELYWDWTVERRDRARAQLHIRLVLVPRIRVDAVLDGLRRAGLAALALAGDDGTRIRLGTTGQGRWARRGTAALATACFLLATAAVVVPFVEQSLQSRVVERRIAALRPAVDQVDAIRRRAATASAGLDALSAQRAKVGDVLAVLAAVTEVLPDDTVLTDLSLNRRVVALTGQSTAAARLIAALAADPAIRNPTFSAPVTRNETTRGEGFSIRAEAAP